MSLEELSSKYIASTEKVLKEIQTVKDPISIDEGDITKIVDYAKDYLEDAKYYKDKKRLEISLASITYSEGLLEALRLLGAVKFEWPTKTERKKEK
jgi:FAD synthetase